jgi:hypothetical protein
MAVISQGGHALLLQTFPQLDALQIDLVGCHVAAGESREMACNRRVGGADEASDACSVFEDVDWECCDGNVLDRSASGCLGRGLPVRKRQKSG